jgi:hypothetical protein
MVTGKECGMGIGGCNRLCSTTTGHSLIALFSLSVSIKDRSLHGPWSSHRFIIRAHTCLWKREDLLFSCHGLRLFPDRLIGGGNRWRSKHHFKPGPQVWGLGVQVWTGTCNTWQEWNGLVLLMPGVQARRVFFGVPSWAHRFANHRLYVTVQLDYALAP